jgi:arginine transport system substrate-binding protein
MKKNLIKNILTVSLSVIAVATLGYYFFVSTSDDQRREDEIVVGTNIGYPPFIFTDEAGNVVGFDVDVVTAIAQKLHKSLVIRNMSFDSLILALKQGRVDMIIGGISITPSREKEIELLAYQGEEVKSFSLLFWQKALPGVARVEDIIKHVAQPVIATQEGTSMYEYLIQFDGKLTIKSLGEIDEVIMDVRYGKSTTALVETPVAYNLLKMHPELKVVTFSLNEKDRYGGNGIGFAKNSMNLIEQVRRIIEKMKSSGEMKLLTDKWFGEK